MTQSNLYLFVYESKSFIFCFYLLCGISLRGNVLFIYFYLFSSLSVSILLYVLFSFRQMSQREILTSIDNELLGLVQIIDQLIALEERLSDNIDKKFSALQERFCNSIHRELESILDEKITAYDIQLRATIDTQFEAVREDLKNELTQCGSFLTKRD